MAKIKLITKNNLLMLMKNKNIFISAIAGLTFFNSYLPVQAQKKAVNQPSSNLINAIVQRISQDFPDDDWNRIKKGIEFNYTEIDLNKDGIKETLVSIQKGYPCSNRHCPVYIYQKKGGNYRFISSVSTLRDGLEVALLTNFSKGWINIAAPIFTYEPREIAWRVFKFDGKEYQITSQKLSSAPSRIMLRKTPGYKF